VLDPEAGPPEDPWLTIAEIADELRCSPATIRSWISKGTLRAMRPGQRKLLVRRSELDRMLAGEDMHDLDDPDAEPPEGGWREMDMIEPPGRSPHWPAEAVKHVTRAGWLGVTETDWRDALTASAMAPPDTGFIDRLLAIAAAAAAKAAALANLEGQEPGPWWQRQSALPTGALSYELRPGGSRPGPPSLWSRFDAAVEQLNLAMQSRSVPAEQHALEQLSLAMHEIADALAERNVYPWPVDWDSDLDEASGDSSATDQTTD
jgi:excisionase family DNA binding protein